MTQQDRIEAMLAVICDRLGIPLDEIGRSTNDNIEISEGIKWVEKKQGSRSKGRRSINPAGDGGTLSSTATARARGIERQKARQKKKQSQRRTER